ncbi:hypothetical protein [Paenibacillus tyrfis]|uniref:hypothetical protein n=1 Tax=Paenibacillus tyrfis TaxID=1501230 RepID=UPI00117D1020|nr:hypothetical protein [Paenibacillus tyrfis]
MKSPSSSASALTDLQPGDRGACCFQSSDRSTCRRPVARSHHDSTGESAAWRLDVAGLGAGDVCCSGSAGTWVTAY